MAGATVTDYISFKTFCSMSAAGDSHAQGLLPLMGRYGGLVRTGAVILIFTGIIMVTINNSLWDEIWFKIKLALAILLVLNGVFIGNSLGMKFRKMASGNFIPGGQERHISMQLNRFYLAQLTLFILIIFVSIVRPGKK
ncbi:hypothetical protein DN068_12325 [Taibaiella soli]|uniref:Uncharacterized protein n=2 Tax=Taibaiella soli TaxID=1649169 RepID=A0A2W2AB61_9BACT|nr:hypothetical protein DN068_12325 [Taibaiella soli]